MQTAIEVVYAQVLHVNLLKKGLLKNGYVCKDEHHKQDNFAAIREKITWNGKGPKAIFTSTDKTSRYQNC